MKAIYINSTDRQVSTADVDSIEDVRKLLGGEPIECLIIRIDVASGAMTRLYVSDDSRSPYGFRCAVGMLTPAFAAGHGVIVSQALDSGDLRDVQIGLLDFEVDWLMRAWVGVDYGGEPLH